MKSYISILSLFLILLFSSITFSQSVIINEIYNSSSNDEWIELLVLEDGLDMRNWSIVDYSSSGGVQAPLNFTSNLLWSNLSKGTLIVIGRSENTFTEDTDISDYKLIVKSNNASYLTGNVFLIAGSSEAVQIKNSIGSHIHGVSWGSANSGTLPQPKIHFTESSTSGTSRFFNEDDISKIGLTTNWTAVGAPTLGEGNTANNLSWISSMRLRFEGSGIVSITPNTVSGDSVLNIVFNYKRDSQFNINSLKIVFPSEFIWSNEVSDVLISEFDCDISVTNDTISFDNVVFTTDSITIEIQNATSPIFTGIYKFEMFSGTDNSLGLVGPTPTITVFGAPIPIADVKVNDPNGVSTRMGDLVTVRGIITVGNEFGSPSYIQDNSGGMSIYGPDLTNAVKVGDEIVVSGNITQFSGLNQIENPILHEILSSGNSLDILTANPTQLANDGTSGVEIYEGMLVRINGVTVTETSGSQVASWEYKNYKLTGSSELDIIDVRIDNNTTIIGMPAPAGVFDIVGVLSQYKTASPFIGGYQIMPRFPSDIISNGPIIEKYPEEISLTENSITLQWSTFSPSTSRIRYGKTINHEMGIVEVDDSLRTLHSVTVSGLDIATIYNLQVFSVANSDTSFSGNIVSSTTSSSLTTGEINVYFNKTIDESVSSGVLANSNINLKQKVIERINNATHSIDLAIYSLSGTVGAEVATALVNAKNRGVKVRVIGEYDTRTTAPWSTLQNNGIPYINDAYGQNDGVGLSHNKFYIFDYNGGDQDKVWVISGSWNATDPGTNDDRQNVIEIQDVALAGAYTTEFNEMWGSSTETPNSSYSRFGARKLNNTPHNFIIGGRKVENYFSPSDRTTSYIGKTLGKAKNTINVALLTFTRRELADSILSLKDRGGKSRVILSNDTDLGTQFQYLENNGIDILIKGGGAGFLHHKYAIIDAEPFGNTSYVITGSHNWSSAAENSNDENTLIIQDNQIANFYLQEFTARYYEAGGLDSIVVTSIDDNIIPSEFSLSQNYPNPFNPSTTINYSIPHSTEYHSVQQTTLKIFDILGREVITLVNKVQSPGNYSVKFNASNLTSGIYFCRMQVNDFIAVKKMILMK
ncbi:MAG: T9SS type A sorting domain-containing protein [Bacteroidetes bacterium]|nr:T9SS type A sorting domain-containing protein [Bacteroidota bacterium]MBU1116359.1 T9SS type A sorting domain-containing protein [Bacteroidota bacterium]MBU1800383.1 T9SS type A sorting domain-containing protein [Bacteroidota bacterium]